MGEFSLTAKQKAVRDSVLLSSAKHSLLYGGSRSGKTFLYCYGIATRGLRADGSRHGIFRKHSVSVKQSIGSDTFPKMMALAYPDCRYRYYEQDGLIWLPNDSEIWLGGLEDKERIDKVLGREYATLYKNEASEITYAGHTTLSTRLAQAVKVTAGEGIGQNLPLKDYNDLNPTGQAHWTYKLWHAGHEPESKKPINRANYVWAKMNPDDNRENLAAGYIDGLTALPEASRRRFYLGEYSGDKQDALWTRQSIQRLFVVSEKDLPVFRRIVVSIDPGITVNDGSNETGIIVAATDEQGKGYVLADASGVMKPEDWARKAVTLFNYYKADCIVAEVNQGGEMVRSTIHAVNPNMPVKMVRASRGKYVRAEPIAALYARSRVEHVGEFETLEDQMCNFTVGFDRSAEGYSPDRMDALVWAFTELFPHLIEDRRDNRSRPAVAEDYNPLDPPAGNQRRAATSGMDYSPF